MTTLRSALIEARKEYEELPAGEIRRSVDNLLNDPTLTNYLDGWSVDVCHIDKDVGYEWDVEAFYEELNHLPF